MDPEATDPDDAAEPLLMALEDGHLSPLAFAQALDGIIRRTCPECAEAPAWPGTTAPDDLHVTLAAARGTAALCHGAGWSCAEAGRRTEALRLWRAALCLSLALADHAGVARLLAATGELAPGSRSLR